MAHGIAHLALHIILLLAMPSSPYACSRSCVHMLFAIMSSLQENDTNHILSSRYRLPELQKGEVVDGREMADGPLCHTPELAHGRAEHSAGCTCHPWTRRGVRSRFKLVVTITAHSDHACQCPRRQTFMKYVQNDHVSPLSTSSLMTIFGFSQACTKHRTSHGWIFLRAFHARDN
jgi:hypothetical protein